LKRCVNMLNNKIFQRNLSLKESILESNRGRIDVINKLEIWKLKLIHTQSNKEIYQNSSYRKSFSISISYATSFYFWRLIWSWLSSIFSNYSSSFSTYRASYCFSFLIFNLSYLVSLLKLTLAFFSSTNNGVSKTRP